MNVSNARLAAPVSETPSFIRRAVDRRGLVHFAAATVAVGLLGSAGLFHAWARTRVTEEGYRLARLSTQQKQLLRERDKLTLQQAQLLRPARIEELARKAGMGPPPADRIIVLVGSREYSTPKRGSESLATRETLGEATP